MVFNKEQKEADFGAGVQGDFVKEKASYWSDKYTESCRTYVKIPYTFGSVTTGIRSAVQQAVDEFNEKTCLRFVKTDGERDYIKIVNKQGLFYFLRFLKNNLCECVFT